MTLEYDGLVEFNFQSDGFRINLVVEREADPLESLGGVEDNL